ncbi:hypothetical protein GBAR_LOCUS28189, partial [Geodia barretti]
MSDTGSATNTTACDEEELQSSSESSIVTDNPIEALQIKIKEIRRRFSSIKFSTIKCLEKCSITVVHVVLLLTEIQN